MSQILHHLLFNRCCCISLYRVRTNLHSLQQCARMPASSGLLSQHALHLFLSAHGIHGVSFLIVVEICISLERTEAIEEDFSHFSLSYLFLFPYLWKVSGNRSPHVF